MCQPSESAIWFRAGSNASEATTASALTGRLYGYRFEFGPLSQWAISAETRRSSDSLCSNTEIENGDLVAFDTDLIGNGGYAIDISRTWLAGDRRASDVQRRMYEAAYRQVTTNIELLQPGTTFRELSERAHVPPRPLHSPTNACIAHGVGLCNEYPLILNRDQFDEGGYDGVIQAGMVFCVESLVAPTGDREAVKLEEQVLVTPSGPTLLSSYPHDERLLS